MKRITTYFKDNFSPQRQKRLAIGLILASLIPLVIGIVMLTSSVVVAYKAIIVSGLFVLGDVVYYIGIALLGKSLYEKYKRFFQRSYWARKYRMLVS